MLWYEWPYRLPLELGIASGREAPPSPRIRTLSPVDRLLATFGAYSGELPRRGQAAIFTSRRERYHALAELCGIAGFSACQMPPGGLLPDELIVGIIDGWESLPAHLENDRTCMPLILLLDWPRPADIGQAQERGIRCVLGQPPLLADFLAAMDDVCPSKAGSVAAQPAA